MIIFELKFDSNKYGDLVAENDVLWESGQMIFDGFSKELWVPPRMRRYNPLLPRARCQRISSGAFGFWENSLPLYRDIAERVGQLLKIEVEKETVHCLNVTNVVNCLDKEKTEWAYGESTKKPISIKKFSFKKNLLPEARIFKIPETVRGSIYYYKPDITDSDDLYEAALGEGSGFKFKPIYEE